MTEHQSKCSQRRQARLIYSLLFLLGLRGMASADVAVESWQPDSAQWQWGRDRQMDLIDTHIDVALDPLIVKAAGHVTLTFAPLVTRLEHLRLDAKRLTIHSVKDESGRVLQFDADDGRFDVHFESPPSIGDTTSITIDYSAAPEMGLYFIPSVAADPNKVPMVWSQGEAEENSFWFPGYDHPNDKGTTSVSVRTPRPNVVISNGRMIKLDEHSDGSRTFHWACGVPNATYLIAVAVGQFDSLVQTSKSGVRCVYYCRKGMGAWLEPSMSDTPHMIDYFEKVTGVPYPYEQYAQVQVTDFIHGGMENAGMTINTETTLHSTRSHDFYRHRTNSLLAHEAAHQWFGDLVTCRDWSQAWLNEGFASYLEDTWIADRWGQDRFLLSILGSQQSGRGAARTRRSTVHHRYVHPDDLFGSYAYSRGASVLHMIRGLVGDSLWWASVNRYVMDNYADNVETVDLKDAVEKTTGREMDWFFDQWIYHGGHPELSVQTEYDEAAGMLTIELEQTQKVDDVTPVFRFPLEVEWITGSDRGVRTFEIDALKSTFYVALSDKPDYVLFDPAGWLLADIEYKPSTAALLEQVKDSERVLARHRAVEALAEKDASDKILGALSTVLRSDPQPGLRSTAADALGKLGGDEARDTLLTALSEPDPTVRNRVIYALAEYDRDDLVYSRLVQIANSNDLDALRASALDAASTVNPDRAAPLAKSASSQRSEKYVIEVDAFTALRRTKDATLIPLGLRFAQPGNPTPVRGAAVGLIGALAEYEKDERTRDRFSLELERYLDDRNMNMRKSAMRAIGALGRTGAIEKLQRVARQSPQNSEQETALAAIKQIRERKPEETPNAVARQLDEEKEAREKLEKKIEELENRLDAAFEGKGDNESASAPK